MAAGCGSAAQPIHMVRASHHVSRWMKQRPRDALSSGLMKSRQNDVHVVSTSSFSPHPQPGWSKEGELREISCKSTAQVLVADMLVIAVY